MRYRICSLTRGYKSGKSGIVARIARNPAATPFIGAGPLNEGATPSGIATRPNRRQRELNQKWLAPFSISEFGRAPACSRATFDMRHIKAQSADSFPLPVPARNLFCFTEPEWLRVCRAGRNPASSLLKRSLLCEPSRPIKSTRLTIF
jgi:hypothetical protein